jgi:DNA-binding GntR family transcriptional regulator
MSQTTPPHAAAHPSPSRSLRSLDPGGGPAAGPRWEPAQVRDRALRHAVTDHVLTALQAGDLVPGERVHETSLARALGVSLSPVREALFQLADRGVLEHRPRRGFYVASLDEAQTREIYTFRALLEGFAARLVAERCRAAGDDPQLQEGLARLESLIEEGRQVGSSGDRQAIAACNARFHDQLVKLAGHGLLERSWSLLAPAEWLLVPTWTWQTEPIQAPELRDWVLRHRRLLDAIRSGAADTAEREAVAHVKEAGESNVRRRFRAPDEA